MKGNYDLLNKRDQVALDFLLDQLYGGPENALKVWQGARGEWVPTTDEFQPIANAMLLFIERGERSSSGFPFTTSPVEAAYFPYSSLSTDEWWAFEAKLFSEYQNLALTNALNLGWHEYVKDMSKEEQD